jgi:hypothetical protein
MVVDTLWNRRVVATYRSEDYRGYRTRFLAKSHAHALAERLNAA